MLATLRQRNFALLWTGGLISFLGNWMLFVALPIYVYQLTGSTLATGAMFMARFVPGLLFGSLAGVLVDRWDRKWTLVATNALLALTILPLLLVRSRTQLPFVYLSAFVESVLGQFLVAEGALLPRLVDEQHLVPANSLNAINGNIARLTGPALAGIVMGTLGLVGVILIDAASYLFAGLMTAFVQVPEGGRENLVSENQRTERGVVARALLGVWSDWLAGILLIRHDRLVRGIFVIWAVAAIAEGIFEVLVVPFVKHVLHGGALEFGWLMSIQAVGGVCGGLLTGWAGRNVRPAHMIGISMLSVGLADLAIWNVPVLTFELAVIGVMGLPAMGFTVGTTTLMQRKVSDAYRGRVSGSLGTTWSALILVGMGGAGLLGGPIGIVTMLNLSGIISFAVGALAFFLLRDERRRVHSGG